MRDVRESAVRLTFEDTLRRQKRLRKKLEQLIREKRPLYSNEVDDYLEDVYKALLTIGRGKKIFYKTNDGVNIPLGNLIYFAEKMIYQKNKIVRIRYNYKIYEIPIEKLWQTLLDYFLMLFPHALWEALHISAERFRYQAKPEALEYFPSVRYGLKKSEEE
ncbi:MAG: hypothetical protein ACTSWZ_02780 [Candidatus Heimdallarchaeaceae archaeon]